MSLRNAASPSDRRAGVPRPATFTARARRWALALLVLPLTGCNFIQNEVFVFDVAPPAPAERPSGVDAEW